mmetsp:Transcript_41607/g.114697  ORF Transcript_41607/g.114697 Transcript_41607/m.114697 type:complete len:201 (-) Transcript_41607:203-805(-)
MSTRVWAALNVYKLRNSCPAVSGRFCDALSRLRPLAKPRRRFRSRQTAADRAARRSAPTRAARRRSLRWWRHPRRTSWPSRTGWNACGTPGSTTGPSNTEVSPCRRASWRRTLTTATSAPPPTCAHGAAWLLQASLRTARCTEALGPAALGQARRSHCGRSAAQTAFGSSSRPKSPWAQRRRRHRRPPLWTGAAAVPPIS